MPNNRSRPTTPSKTTAGSTTKNPRAQAAASRTKPGTKKTASSQRFAERQTKKQKAASEARRARNRRYGIITIALVVCVVLALVIVKVAGGGSGNGSATVDQPSPPAGTPIPAATLAKIASVPITTLNSAPTVGILNTVQPVSLPALTAKGKPEILFIGAEFCPHCAAERWPLYIALSKFGTFDPPPGRIHSANEDGDVPTLTFYGTTYTSPYFTFVPVEVYTNHPSGDSYVTLQTPTEAQLKLWQEINGGSFPFVDLGGQHVLGGAQYSFADLENLPFSEVESQVGNNSTAIGAEIDASAAALIKSICGSLSNDQPADVCRS